MGGQEQNMKNVSEDQIPYPFQPPSASFCENNKLGSDVYFSVFAPCNFTFYVPTGDSAATDPSNVDSFSCEGIVDNPNEQFYVEETSRVFNWPDSCVALGPRCYDLSMYPGLANYTRINVDDGSSSYYGIEFPEEANYVSVDCSADFKLAEEAIAFSGLMAFAVILTVAITICCICCCANKRRGYTSVAGVYSGPPVEGRKIIV